MSGAKINPLRYLLQAVNYSVFMGLIWFFSSAPTIQVLEENQAMITLAFSHAGDLREPCRKLSSEELAELAANMRKLEDCPRERSPVVIEALLDGETLYSELLQPAGLFKDGGVDVYYSRVIPVGKHNFEIKMDDSIRNKGFNYLFSQKFDINPAQILLVEFDSLTGFVVR
jgi:hypothetical protein